MAQVTLRLPDDLLEQIEADAGPETSRSEWLRQAARLRLADDRDDRLDDLERRVSDLEAELDRPLWERVF